MGQPPPPPVQLFVSILALLPLCIGCSVFQHKLQRSVSMQLRAAAGGGGARREGPGRTALECAGLQALLAFKHRNAKPTSAWSLGGGESGSPHAIHEPSKPLLSPPPPPHGCIRHVILQLILQQPQQFAPYLQGCVPELPLVAVAPSPAPSLQFKPVG